MLDVPSDIVVTADPGEVGKTVTYPAPTASGGTPPVLITCDRSSGAFYPLGVTTVTCAATDTPIDAAQLSSTAPANETIDAFAALTATKSFTITVLESSGRSGVPGPTPSAATVAPSPTIPSPALPSGVNLPATGTELDTRLSVIAAFLVLFGAVILVARRQRATPHSS